MSWQRYEVWLDTDLLWFGDRSSADAASLALRAPAFLGLAPAVGTDVALPNGLAESRRRRAERHRRHNTRKTRVAALAIGPAVVMTLASGRVSSSRAAGALQQDPPSQTFRAVPGEGAARSIRSAPNRDRAARATPETPVAKIAWREATSHGLPYSGWLTDGTQLPVEGPNWVTWNPVVDRSPNLPRRLVGHEHTIRRIVAVLAAFREANPNAPRVVVGDISLEGGGPMDQHRSHQNGLDVDVYYPRLDRALRAPVRSSQVDRRLAQDLLDRFVAAGAQVVFVGYSTGLRGPGGVVVPYPYHENHMHVRFRRPPG